MDHLEQFLNFVEQSPTAFHAVANLKEDPDGRGPQRFPDLQAQAEL